VLQHLGDDEKTNAPSADKDMVEVRDSAVAGRRGHVSQLEVPAVLGLGEVAAEGLSGLELDLEMNGVRVFFKRWRKKGGRGEKERRSRFDG